MDTNQIINEFQAWCDEMDERCPVICSDALYLLKEQRERIYLLEERIGIMGGCE